MSYVGVFSKVEMDEKPYMVYTLTQTDNPTSSGESLAMDSSGRDNLPLQPLFFCPAARIRLEMSKLKRDDHGDYIDEFLPFISSPHFPSTRSGDQQGKSLLDYEGYGICKLPVLPLFWCNNKEEEFLCGACEEPMVSSSYYACLECEKEFHKECVESPLEIKHHSHPLHSLQLYNLPNSESMEDCICCGAYLHNMLYHCSTCKLSMHPVCAMKPVTLVVDHPKSHPHPLTFFPAQASLVCHICGLIKNLDPTYICVQCVFVIHKDCIDFPHVIRISRHNHRISFTSSLPSGDLSCGVCWQQVDNDYGAYSCNKGDAYFVHSKCALDKKVWDGKDLEGVPEEDDMIDDGEPFERIADGIILHISHSHNLRLEISSMFDDNKYCLGCVLPIYEGQFYTCMECDDFILHESCANAPRMIRHPLNPHPLTLNFDAGAYDNNLIEGFFTCTACCRQSNGFAYEHITRYPRFKLDLRCASITEPFEYQGHNHPLFLPLDPCKKARCQVCKYEGNGYKLNCSECDYVICFSCATLPWKVKYKHDSHFLTSCHGKEENDQPVWCEVCESKIVLEEETEEGNYRKEFHIFYKCAECCTALHVSCALGKDIYMKPGIPTTKFEGLESYVTRMLDYQIISNNSPTRPICNGCKRRCPFPIVVKEFQTIFCSLLCMVTRSNRNYCG